MNLKTSNPSKWYSQRKKLGDLDIQNSGKLQVESLAGLNDRECAEAVAQAFAAVSMEYSLLERSQLPAFLPANRLEEVTVLEVLQRIKSLGKIPHTGDTNSLDRYG